jgi:hypothetical protein
MEVTGSVAGGSLLVHLPALPRSATAGLLDEALARGVRIRSAERFHRKPPARATLLLSYAGIPELSLKRAGARRRCVPCSRQWPNPTSVLAALTRPRPAGDNGRPPPIAA